MLAVAGSPGNAQTAFDVSNLFMVNTRSPMESATVSAASGNFTVNTLLAFGYSSTNGISGLFSLDTRYITSGFGSAFSNLFTLDTRYRGTGGYNAAPAPAIGNRPVVLLVRGFRPLGPPQEPLAYWQAMNERLIQQLPWARVVLVGNDVFDGTGTVALAGARLRGVVEYYAQSGSVDVYIVAHSMGGLVTRSCLSQMGSRRSWVRKVVMLATPNCGTHIADVATVVGAISASGLAGNTARALALGIAINDPGRCASVLDLRTNRVLDMALQWNDRGNGYHLVGGTSNSGLANKAGSAILAYWPSGTVNANDGVVTRMSAHGEYWGGNVVYRFPIATLPAATISQHYLNHDAIKSAGAALDEVASVLAGSYRGRSWVWVAGLDDETGPVDPASEEPQDVLLSLYDADVSGGQTAEFAIPVDELAEVSFTLNTQGGPADFALVQPDGTRLTPASPGSAEYSEAEDSGIIQAAYRIPYPAVGQWKVEVSSQFSALSAGTASGKGWLTLRSATAGVQMPGACFIAAELVDRGNPVPGATVSALCRDSEGNPVALTLLDDGMHGDGAVDDGLYAALLPNPAPDEYTVSLEASGEWQSRAFARLATASFAVSPATAFLLGGCVAEGIDEGGNAAFEKLRVNTGVRVHQGSAFRLSAELRDEAGRAVDTAVTDVSGITPGDHSVSLDFDGDAIRRAGVTGNLTLGDVVLSDTSFEPPLRVAAEETLCVFTAPSPASFSDTTPPDAVSDLAVALEAGTSVTLSWTAPSSEGQSALAYDLRVSEDGFSYSSWDSKPSVPGMPLPALPGTTQSVTVTGLVPGKYYWFCIRSIDFWGNLSELSNLAWTGVAAAFRPGMDEGIRARYGGVVTAAFPGFVYVERPDRANGIAVDVAPTDLLTPGTLVDVLGDVKTVSGEPRLANTAILPTGQADVPLPVQVQGSLVGITAARQPVATTGVLVKIAGRVVFVGPGAEFLVLTDGSDVRDPAGLAGVRVESPNSAMSGIAAGDYLVVTGVSSCYASGDIIYPRVLLRSAEDIQVVVP